MKEEAHLDVFVEALILDVAIEGDDLLVNNPITYRFLQGIRRSLGYL